MKMLVSSFMLLISIQVVAFAQSGNENHPRAGIYKNFEELKNNNPSGEFNYPITTKIRRCSQGHVNLYKIDISKSQARVTGKVFGFSDGKDVYINEKSPSLRPGTKFVKVEILDRYYYYQNIEPLYIPAGNTIMTVPKLVQKIMNINTGEVSILNNTNLKKLIADNTQLLNEFEKESQKDKKLKEYLIRYLDTKYNEKL